MSQDPIREASVRWSSKPNTIESILACLEPITESGCWIWGKDSNGHKGHIDYKGYGTVSYQGKSRKVHRIVYEHFKGPIPKGLVPDHLCRVRCCANPDHIELVRNKINVLRGISFAAINAVKTHCPKGHPYEGTRKEKSGAISRYCKECWKIRWRLRVAKNPALMNASRTRKRMAKRINEALYER